MMVPLSDRRRWGINVRGIDGASPKLRPETAQGRVIGHPLYMPSATASNGRIGAPACSSSGDRCMTFAAFATSA